MVASVKKTPPRFYPGQRVRFIGGIGIIKQLRPEARIWIYQIEMAMGPTSAMGRIGHETTVVLSEADMMLVEQPWFRDLAIA